MAKQKIMMALGNEKLEKAIQSRLQDEYIFSGVATRKGMIIPVVAQENPDVLIVIEKLIGELNEDIYEILYKLRVDYPLMRIIYLYTLEEDELEKVIKYTQIGIYDIWTERQISLPDIVEMVKKPKNFGDWAKVLNKQALEQEGVVPTNITIDKSIKEVAQNAGHLKLKQDDSDGNTPNRFKTMPNLVVNKGLNMGRVKRNPMKVVADEPEVEFENTNTIDLTPKGMSAHVVKAEEPKINDDIFDVKEEKKEEMFDVLSKLDPELNEEFDIGTEIEPKVKKEPEKDKTLRKGKNFEEWVCPECGSHNIGNFCGACGTKRPAPEKKEEKPVEVKQEEIKPIITEESKKEIEIPKVEVAEPVKQEVKEIAPRPVREVESSTPQVSTLENGKMVTRIPLRQTPGLAARRASQLQKNKEKTPQKDITKRVIAVPEEVKQKQEETVKKAEQKQNNKPKQNENKKHQSDNKKNNSAKQQNVQKNNQKNNQQPKKQDAPAKEVKPTENKPVEVKETKPQTEVKVKSKPVEPIKPVVEVTPVVEVKQEKTLEKPVVVKNKEPEVKEEVFEKCRIVVFANTESVPMAHTALNTAILLAEKGKQVVYVDTLKTSAADLMLHKNPKVNLYGKYLIHSCNLMVEKEFLRLAFIKTLKETNVFELVKQIMMEKEAEYIVINTDIHDDLEKLIILSDKNFILMKQSPVQLRMLKENYSYRFKYMDIVLEEYDETRLSVKKIIEQTKCGKVIKINDSDNMNYKTTTEKKPLVFNQSLKDDGIDTKGLYSKLVSIIESEATK